MPTILFGILRSQESCSLRHCRCGKHVCITVRVELFVTLFGMQKPHMRDDEAQTPNDRSLLRNAEPGVLLNEVQHHHQHADSRATDHAQVACEQVRKTQIMVQAKKLIKGCGPEIGRFGGLDNKINTSGLGDRTSYLVVRLCNHSLGGVPSILPGPFRIPILE